MFDCAEFCSADAVEMIGNGVGDGVGDGIKVRFLRAEVMGKLRASNLESLKAWGVRIALLEGLAPLNQKKNNTWKSRVLIAQGPCYFTCLAQTRNQCTDQGIQANPRHRSMIYTLHFMKTKAHRSRKSMKFKVQISSHLVMVICTVYFIEFLDLYLGF